MQTGSVHVSAKLKDGSDVTGSVKAIKATDGVMFAEPTFPGETDSDLASLVSVVLDNKKARKALAAIKRRAYVESAFRTATRTLIQ